MMFAATENYVRNGCVAVLRTTSGSRRPTVLQR
ncbi:hypothetical protein EV192_102162 [Actinocrispum wychmicini]|uniref:Uncharacterized protein n=1 Tax=Actinocrispum wychmicini TaxID=1213861 RepID=A0A4R2K6P9_9PSEU|nr:hypothetical protein EV192_102162 [Actinocrispum wychmicini]